MIAFQTEGHKYTNIDLFDDTKWVSASRLSGMFKKSFDPVATSLKVSQKKSSKWYGTSPTQIQEIWTAENVRATTLGDWYHKREEDKLIGKEFEEYEGRMLPIIKPVWENGVKFAPDQKLSDGIYPELLVYLKSAGVCGQFDKPIICNGFVDIDDYKSNKDLKKPAFVNWEGVTEKMLPPLLHLDNCKLVEYALQLSIGMYIILRHNPLLKPRNLTLHHVTFEVEGEDKWGYPILRLENNEPIVKGVEKIQVPYLKREVELMFDYLKRTK